MRLLITAPCTKWNWSHGVDHCARLIRDAGIPLAEVTWERRHEYRIIDPPLIQETR